MRRVVAIVGCQRSGTTLTGHILGAQPGALLLDEPDGVYDWIRAGGRDPVLETGLLLRAAAKYVDPGSRVRLTGGSAALAEGVDTLVLKTPNLTYDEALLGALDVPVSVIYLARDPRAVAASMAQLRQIDFVGNQAQLLNAQPDGVKALYAAELAGMVDAAQSSWTRRGLVWRVKTGRADAFRRSGLSVFPLAYEQMVVEPSAVVADLCETCGLGPCDDRPGLVYETYRGAGPDGAPRPREVDRTSLDAWRQRLAPSEVREVMEAAEPLATTLGYG